MSDTSVEVAKAIVGAYKLMKAARKDAANPHFGSRYADSAAIDDVVRPALAEHGLAVVQSVQFSESLQTQVVTTRLLHESGEWMESDSLYIVPSRGDGPQAHGSALTYARRYGLMCAVGLAVSDASDDDGHAASSSARNQPAQAAQGNTQPNVPKRMQSRHDGSCAICECKISRGEWIAYARAGGKARVAHWSCYEERIGVDSDVPADPQAAEADTPEAEPNDRVKTKMAQFDKSVESVPDDDLPF